VLSFIFGFILKNRIPENKSEKENRIKKFPVLKPIAMARKKDRSPNPNVL